MDVSFMNHNFSYFSDSECIERTLKRLNLATVPGQIYSPAAEAIFEWYAQMKGNNEAAFAMTLAAIGETPLEIFYPENELGFAVYFRDHVLTHEPHLYSSRNVRVRFIEEKQHFRPGGLLLRAFPSSWRSPVAPVASGPILRVITVPSDRGRKVDDISLLT